MRKPNGYGSIKHLSGHRRRPFVFVVTEQGRQKPVEYFTSQVEAEIFAADYNKIHRHTSLAGHRETLAEVYCCWRAAHIADTEPSASTIASYQNSWRHLEPLGQEPIAGLKHRDYQGILDGMRKSGLGYSSLKKVRSLISLVEKYALETEVISRAYAPLLRIGKNHPVRPHHVISRQKINRLWANADQPGADTVLILLYTGMRCGELLALRKADVSLRQQAIRITRSKTQAGIRTIPIHHRILPLIAARMGGPEELLITDAEGRGYSYTRYCTVWRRAMALVNGSKHTTHDCRHTVATLLDNAGANETAKRRILGHAGGDVTERVYTHKGLRQLRRCIELLK